MSSPPDPLSFHERGNGAGFGGEAMRRGRVIDYRALSVGLFGFAPLVCGRFRVSRNP